MLRLAKLPIQARSARVWRARSGPALIGDHVPCGCLSRSASQSPDSLASAPDSLIAASVSSHLYCPASSWRRLNITYRCQLPAVPGSRYGTKQRPIIWTRKRGSLAMTTRGFGFSAFPLNTVGHRPPMCGPQNQNCLNVSPRIVDNQSQRCFWQLAASSVCLPD